jgi:hypothetical protein
MSMSPVTLNSSLLSTTAQTPSHVRRRTAKSAGAEYWLVFGICLVVFFVVLALEHLLPRSWRRISTQFDAPTLRVEAMAAAHRYTNIAFQG